MATTFVKVKSVKAFAKGLGKRVRKDYLEFLEGLVEEEIRADAAALGAGTVLSKSAAKERRETRKLPGF